MANPLSGFWSRLTPRERTYLLVLILVFFVMGTVMLFYLRGQTLRRTEEDIVAHRVALEQMYTRGAVHKEKLKQKEDRESKISSDKAPFATLLEEAKRGVDELTYSDEEELPPLELGESQGLMKRTFSFRLRGVTLANMTKFLAALESKEGRIILTEGLKVRSQSAVEDRLNADVVLATWEREEEEEEEDAQEDAAP